jgi:hypothetical protein
LRFGESKREDRTVIIMVIILANKPLYPWLWCFVISCHPNSDEGARYGYFVRSGIVDPTNTAGTFRHAGVIGYEWSSRTSPTSSTLAYWFEFNATESRPSYGPYDRYNQRSPPPLPSVHPRWVPIFCKKQLLHRQELFTLGWHLSY